MVVPDTLLRHLAPAPEWPLCAHSSCSNNTLHIYESGRDSTGEKSENWFLTLWLCSLVWHSKIKSHSLHCSDFSPEWQPCARTSCSNKILQSYESCISEGAEIQLSFAIDFLSCGCTTWSRIKRFSHRVCTAPAFPQNGTMCMCTNLRKLQRPKHI